MRTIMVTGNETIRIGRVGENMVTQVIWPGLLEKWRNLYGEGSVYLAVRRPKDTTSYPVVCKVSENDVTWTVQAADTALHGTGECELTYIVGEAIAKSQTWATEILRSLTEDEMTEPPDDPAKSWFMEVRNEIGNLGDLKTKDKTNLVSAINEAVQSGCGSGTSDHTKLENRDADDQHPMSAITGLVDALDGKQPAGDYLTQDDLKNATNEVLEQAKASGEFDGADGHPGENGADGYSPTANVTQNDNGATITITDKNGTTTATVTNGKDGLDGSPGADGKSAYQYAQDGGYTGTEAEFSAKLAEEMPTTLPNPNALTFTGAASGSYDGSEPLTVEIPSGGGGGSGENWRLVNTITTTEDVSNITITQDSDGNPISLKKVSIFAKVRGNSSSLSAWCRITVNNLQNYFYSDLQNTFAATEGQDYYNRSRADFSVRSGRLMLDLLLRSLNNAASKNTLYLMANTGVFENYPDAVDAITSVRLWSSSAGIGAGTEIQIYGVDA